LFVGRLTYRRFFLFFPHRALLVSSPCVRSVFGRLSHSFSPKSLSWPLRPADGLPVRAIFSWAVSALLFLRIRMFFLYLTSPSLTVFHHYHVFSSPDRVFPPWCFPHFPFAMRNWWDDPTSSPPVIAGTDRPVSFWMFSSPQSAFSEFPSYEFLFHGSPSCPPPPPPPPALQLGCCFLLLVSYPQFIPHCLKPSH